MVVRGGVLSTLHTISDRSSSVNYRPKAILEGTALHRLYYDLSRTYLENVEPFISDEHKSDEGTASSYVSTQRYFINQPKCLKCQAMGGYWLIKTPMKSRLTHL